MSYLCHNNVCIFTTNKTCFGLQPHRNNFNNLTWIMFILNLVWSIPIMKWSKKTKIGSILALRVVYYRKVFSIWPHLQFFFSKSLFLNFWTWSKKSREGYQKILKLGLNWIKPNFKTSMWTHFGSYLFFWFSRKISHYNLQVWTILILIPIFLFNRLLWWFTN